MLRDITIGQYYPAESLIHRLDPRTKIVCTLLYLISLFLINNTAGYVLATILLVLYIRSSQLPLKYMMRGIKAVLILLFLTVIFNLFLTQGTVLVRFGIFKITEEGIRAAVFMAIRLLYLILGASVMTLTTTPNALTDGLERLLRPLRVIRVPVHEIAMMMSIALRFIPILMEEMDKIMKAQIARGADLESGNLIRRAKALVPILVPLFVSAFRRANDLSMAMEARCYHGGENRTKMKPLVYARRDYLTYAGVVLYVAAAVVIGRILPLHLWVF